MSRLPMSIAPATKGSDARAKELQTPLKADMAGVGGFRSRRAFARASRVK
jgi:hypothetical protein